MSVDKPTQVDKLQSAWAELRRHVNHVLPAVAGSLKSARGRLPH